MLKIVITNNTYNQHIDGIASSSQALGHDCIFWNTVKKPMYDMAHELNPDIIFYISAHLNIQLIENIKPDYPNIKFVCLDNIELSARSAVIVKTLYDDKFKSDILYMDLNNSQDPLFFQQLSFLTKPNTQYDVKIFGPARILMPEYLGQIDPQQASVLMSSTKICLDNKYNILYDAAFTETFCLSNKKNDLFPSFDNIDELLDLTDTYMTNTELRQNAIKHAKQQIKNKTYFHKLEDIFHTLEYESEAKQCKEKYELL